MLNVPSSIKSLYQTDGVKKNFRVHFPNGEYPDITNDNVVQESVKFTESLSSQSVFKFGLAEASVLEFETVGIGNMFGMTIEASLEIDTSSLSVADIAAIEADEGDGSLVNGYYRIPLGTFIVNSCPRNHGAMAHRQVTAYSRRVKNSTELQGLNFTWGTPWDKIYINKAALVPLLANDLSSISVLKETEAKSRTDVGVYYSNYFWNSSGKLIQLSIMDADTNKDMGFVVPIIRFPVYDAHVPAFFSVDFADQYDPTAYENYGKKIAQTLSDAGFDITYNRDGAKIYANNEEALRTLLPWFFTPSVGYEIEASLSEVTYRITNGLFSPVAGAGIYPALAQTNGYQGSAPNDKAFYVDDKQSTYKIGYGQYGNFWYLGKPTGENVNIRVQTYSNGDLSTVQTTDNIPVIGSGYIQSALTATIYYLNEVEEYLAIKQTGAINRTTSRRANSDGTTFKALSLPLYSYVNAVDLVKLTEGSLEINAQFLKMGRKGDFLTVRLDNSNPIMITPESYSEMWWDEYDVDPIGTVTVTYQGTDEAGKETETTVDIPIGSGASRYDMSNNEALKNLANSSLAGVTDSINTRFKPHTDEVAFTPAELTLQSMPWLEAGDALEIEAEDGTIVETYALRVEMSGIQQLQSVITAEGGEIIEEVS